MPKDLRTFLEDLKRDYPEEALTIRRSVDTKWEMSAVAHKLQVENRFPLLYFENVQGYDMPVVSNVFASRKLLACALRTIPDKLAEAFLKAEGEPIKPLLVHSGPVKEVRLLGRDVDLRKLPIVWHCEEDAGPFITPGVTVMKDPDTGIRNLGVYRHQLHEPGILGISLGPPTHGAHIFRKAEAKGQDLEAAIFLGHHPAVGIGSQFGGSLDVDEFDIIGGLLGEPLELVKCETVDLEVPAFAEIVIEGLLKGGVRRPDAPFGEFTRYYGEQRDNCVFEVSAITHRRDAIFHDLYLGAEHVLMGHPAQEALAYKHIKSVIPQLKAVHIPFSGVGMLIFVQIKKEYDGLGKNAALVALGAEAVFETAVVVDEDVDIFNEQEVTWAVMTRADPSTSFFMVPEARVIRLNPSSHSLSGRSEGGLKTKLGIDATKPVDLPFAKRAEPPRALWQKLRIEDYL